MTQFDGSPSGCDNTPYSEVAHKALLNVVRRNHLLLNRVLATAKLDSAARRALEAQRAENVDALLYFAEDEGGAFLMEVQS